MISARQARKRAKVGHGIKEKAEGAAPEGSGSGTSVGGGLKLDKQLPPQFS